MTIGRVLYRQYWDFQQRQQKKKLGAVPDINTEDAVETMLSAADIDPFLPNPYFSRS